MCVLWFSAIHNYHCASFPKLIQKYVWFCFVPRFLCGAVGKVLNSTWPINAGRCLRILAGLMRLRMGMAVSCLWPASFNSLAPGWSECDSKNVIFQSCFTDWYLQTFHDNALRWMPQDLTDDKSTLLQVMAWCRRAPSHYLSQCWLSSLSPYSVVRPQRVNILRQIQDIHHFADIFKHIFRNDNFEFRFKIH